MNNDKTVKGKKSTGKLDMAILLCTIFKIQRGLMWNYWGILDRGRKVFFNLLCRHTKGLKMLHRNPVNLVTILS